jgi:hypothetical protein
MNFCDDEGTHYCTGCRDGTFCDGCGHSACEQCAGISHCSITDEHVCDGCRAARRTHLRATTILCLENYAGGAPAPRTGGLDGAIAHKHYVKDTWSVILSFLDGGEFA